MIRKFLVVLLTVAIAALSLVPMAEARRVSITTGYSGAPYTYNITSTNTSNLRTVWAGQTRNAQVAINGDSTAKGVNETAIPYNTQYSQGALAVQLASVLSASGVTSAANNWYGLSGATLNDYVIRDGRLTVSGGTVSGSNQYQGGTEIRFPGVASGATLTFNNVDTCNIVWVNQTTSNRVMSYQVDGGTVNNLTTTGTAAIITSPPGNVALGAVGTHTLNFAWVSGGTTLLPGVNCWNSSRLEISILNEAISGGVSANMIANSGTPGAGRIQQLTNFPPDLVITEMGLVNDCRTSVSVATSKANMTSFVQSMKAIGVQVLFLTPPYDNSSPCNVNQAAYVTAMYQVAAEQGIGLIDIQKRWHSYNNAVTNGWQYNPGIASAATITNATWANGVATFTTSGATTLATGVSAAVTSVVSSGGVAPNGFNALGKITVIDSTHFTMPIAQNPGTYTSGGTVPATDNVHPTLAGYADEAQVVSQVIQAILQNKFAANDNVPGFKYAAPYLNREAA